MERLSRSSVVAPSTRPEMVRWRPAWSRRCRAPRRTGDRTHDLVQVDRFEAAVALADPHLGPEVTATVGRIEDHRISGLRIVDDLDFSNVFGQRHRSSPLSCVPSPSPCPTHHILVVCWWRTPTPKHVGVQGCNYSRVTTRLSTLSGSRRRRFREISAEIAAQWCVTTTTRSGVAARGEGVRSHTEGLAAPPSSVRGVTEPTAPRRRRADRRASAGPRIAGGPLWDPTAIPAATVVVVRDGTDGLEVLICAADRDLAFAGGTWVFPGGRIDPTDHTRRGAGPGTRRPSGRA